MIAPPCSLEQLQAAMNTSQNVRQVLFQMSTHLMRETSRRFVPYYGSRQYFLKSPVSEFWFYDDLLELTALTHTINDTAIDLDELILLLNGRTSEKPYNTVRRQYGLFLDKVTITGLWGYAPHYGPDSWDTADVTLAADLNSTDTTVTLNAYDALDSYGSSFLQTFGFYRLEDELLICTDPAATPAVFERGAHGSVAASHLTGVTLERFIPDPGIVQIGLGWAKWLHHEQSQHTRQSSVKRGAPGSFTNSDLFQRLDHYRRFKL